MLNASNKVEKVCQTELKDDVTSRHQMNENFQHSLTLFVVVRVNTFMQIKRRCVNSTLNHFDVHSANFHKTTPSLSSA
jgi:primosomal replication protein N